MLIGCALWQKESREEEQTFAKKLHEDFSRFPVCDEILTGKHVGPSEGTLMETPTVRQHCPQRQTAVC